jgi:U3 small nucleolar ribonucleoprotein protein LCP5
VKSSRRYEKSNCPTSSSAHFQAQYICRATTTSDLHTRDGISLLSLKNHVLLSYLQSLVLLSSRRALGHSLSSRSAPSQPFSSTERELRGGEPGDLVDSMIEGRVVLEKIKALENRMRYQIDKLVRTAEETTSTSNKNAIDGSFPRFIH